MRFNELFTIGLMSSGTLGAVIDLVPRDYISAVSAGCTADMGACLGDMGVENFKYQKSRLLDNQLNAWSICGKSAEQSGSCLKGVGDMAMSEVGQMYFWQMDADLVQSRKLCKEFKCNLKGARDSSCSSFACGACGMDGRCTSV